MLGAIIGDWCGRGLVDPDNGTATPNADMEPSDRVAALAADIESRIQETPLDGALNRWASFHDLSNLPGIEAERRLDAWSAPPGEARFAPWPVASAWTADDVDKCVTGAREDCGTAYPENGSHAMATIAVTVALRRALEGTASEPALQDIAVRAGFDPRLDTGTPLLRAVSFGIRAAFSATSFAQAMAFSKLPPDLAAHQPCASFVAGLICEPRVEMPGWAYLLALDHAGEDFLTSVSSVEAEIDRAAYLPCPLKSATLPKVPDRPSIWVRLLGFLPGLKPLPPVEQD